MPLASSLGLFCISVGASAPGRALGLASGVFIVPILTMVIGVDILVAIRASIVSAIACSCGSAAPFLRERLTNARLAILLETATTLRATSGLPLSGVVPVPVLYAIFVIVLLVSAGQMRRRRAVVTAGGNPAQGWTRRLDAVYPDRTLGRDVAYRVDRLPAALGLMYKAGLLSALLGIGGGVLKIPVMDTRCDCRSRSRRQALIGLLAADRVLDRAINTWLRPDRSRCRRGEVRH